MIAVNAGGREPELNEPDIAQPGRLQMAKDSTKLVDLMEQAREVFALNPMMGPQIEQFLKAQDDILEETEAFSTAWFQRRHEAAHSALEAVRKADGHGGDPSNAMQAMIDWQQGSFRRMADDVQGWVELCSRCAGCMTRAEVEAGKEGAEEIAKRAKTAAHTNHATPV